MESRVAAGLRYGPQSTAHVPDVSPLSHDPLPQQYRGVAIEAQVFPLAVHRKSEQLKGFVPSPSPQQYRLVVLPLCTPLQSDGQLRQSSPSAVSQTSLPQRGPPPMHSLWQLLQSSPASQTLSRSHTLHPDVSNPVQSALQANVPLPKPCVRQVAPPRSEPSQASVASRIPLPQVAQPVQVE